MSDFNFGETETNVYIYFDLDLKLIGGGVGRT